MQEKTFDLFEYLREQVCCEYISDLSRTVKANPLAIIHALAAIHPADYPLKQWNDALNYFANAPAQSTAEEAYALLLSALSDAETAR